MSGEQTDICRVNAPTFVGFAKNRGWITAIAECRIYEKSFYIQDDTERASEKVLSLLYCEECVIYADEEGIKMQNT
ncbi:MAG: hypothetical protein NTV00_14695 [Methylococcales bacterium]|nr:hypothetical protein [Methylococcales bacterium]